jgi:plastocyanin
MTSTPTADSRTDERSTSVDFGLIAVTIIAALGLVFGVVAFTTGDDGDGGSVAAAGGPTTVTLTEFAISPDDITIAAGGTLEVENGGTQIHNLRVRDTDLATPDLPGGETGALDVSSLEPGDYELYCDIAGHADAGMEASLVVEEGGEGAAGAAGAAGGGGVPLDRRACGRGAAAGRRAGPGAGGAARARAAAGPRQGCPAVGERGGARGRAAGRDRRPRGRAGAPGGAAAA